ncbi:MAG: hypothetical protein EA401_01930 [Planctomycetota bacterium]|nr:MAG: hypothetical protein EA401_01930 [Planctomycetota bacterium]
MKRKISASRSGTAKPSQTLFSVRMPMANASPDHNPAGDTHNSTAHVIEAARRPLIVARHQDTVNTAFARIDAEQALATDTDNTVARELFSCVIDDDSLHRSPLREALIEHCCLGLDNGDIAAVDLPLLLATCLHLAHDALSQYPGMGDITLDELNECSCEMLHLAQTHKDPPPFHHPDLKPYVLWTPAQEGLSLHALHCIASAEGGDRQWQEAAGEPSLGREQEEPLEDLPEAKRRIVRQQLVRERIRQLFAKKVFINYLDRDSLDPNEIAAYPRIIDWLGAIGETPHLFSFMQGQTQAQKIFRLQQLWHILLQLRELALRLHTAAQHPSYRDTFVDLHPAQQLEILVQDRYPAATIDRAFCLTVAHYPFAAFVEWVQNRVADETFLLPPPST